MTESIPQLLHPLILSWNLRNLVEAPSKVFAGSFCIESVEEGEYPIRAPRKLPLELPSAGKKTHIAGRMSYAAGLGMPEPVWSVHRTIKLPMYSSPGGVGPEVMECLVRLWPSTTLPEDIPCVALASRCSGLYTDGREAQNVAVLLVWSDGVCRIVTLDWSEGSPEDCVTPEWCIQSSPLMGISAASQSMESMHSNLLWNNPEFSITILPNFLGAGLRGERVECPSRPWRREWIYKDPAVAREDLRKVLSTVQALFRVEFAAGAPTADADFYFAQARRAASGGELNG
ncbi:MAG: hypothetical protein QXH42_04920 [Thermoplasmata archaeon]